MGVGGVVESGPVTDELMIGSVVVAAVPPVVTSGGDDGVTVTLVAGTVVISGVGVVTVCCGRVVVSTVPVGVRGVVGVGFVGVV